MSDLSFPCRHPRQQPCDQAGFSMIEMLAAAVILAVGILGLTSLQVMTLRSNAGSRNMTRAVQVAEGLLEAALQEGRVRRACMISQDTIPAVAGSSLTGGNAAIAKTIYAEIDGTLRTLADGSYSTNSTGAFFTVSYTFTPVQTNTAGKVANATVEVSFFDEMATGLTVPRKLFLRRVVNYA